MRLYKNLITKSASEVVKPVPDKSDVRSKLLLIQGASKELTYNGITFVFECINEAGKEKIYLHGVRVPRGLNPLGAKGEVSPIPDYIPNYYQVSFGEALEFRNCVLITEGSWVDDPAKFTTLNSKYRCKENSFKEKDILEEDLEELVGAGLELVVAFDSQLESKVELKPKAITLKPHDISSET